MHHYIEANAESVPAEVRREVHRMRWYIAETLGVSPKIRFYEPSDEKRVALAKAINKLALRVGEPVRFAATEPRERRMLGFYSEGTPEHVWIDAKAPTTDVASTVAHELRHAWQHARGWMECMDRDDLEADAEACEKKAL